MVLNSFYGSEELDTSHTQNLLIDKRYINIEYRLVLYRTVCVTVLSGLRET